MEKIGQDHLPFTFDFAGHHADGFTDQFLNIRLLLPEHVDGAAGMKAAHDNGDPGGAENARHVESAGKLVGLHADHTNQQSGAGLAAPAKYLIDGNFFGGFVEGRHFDGQIAK